MRNLSTIREEYLAKIDDIIIDAYIEKGTNMSMTREDRVAEFNIAGGNADVYHEGLLSPQVECFSEELLEFNQALADYVADPTNENRRQMIKEWADVQVTLSNFAWFFNFNGEEAFTRVADSNMSKLTDGVLLKNESGKILKGPNYQAPDMGGL